jgi:hypothetical protein
MWLTTDEGQIVNLDRVQRIVVEGARVVAQFDHGQLAMRLIEPTKAAPQHYVDQIAVALSNGTLHMDLRHL